MSETYRTIKEAEKALEQGQTSARALTEAALTAIDERDEQLHAFLHVDREGALVAADASDIRRKEGKSIGLIDGIPISIKDVLVTKDMPSTAGDRMLEGYRSPFDATVVARLRAAGAIILGKTNCDAWAHGSSTEHSAYGPSRNPWDTTRVPGGSSGGSAVAVASGMSLAALGTDTGGSIRQPAALTGITGFKPTYGRCSRYGLIAMGSSLDCPGPLARTAEDCALLFDLMKGHDPLDATSLPNQRASRYQLLASRKTDRHGPQSSKLKAESYSLAGRRIGIPKEYFGEGLDPAVANVVREALAVYESLGAELIDIELPLTKYGIAAYYIIMPAEVSSNLARMDGIRFGQSVIASQRDLPAKAGWKELASIRTADDLIRANRTAGFGPEAKRRIMLGTYVLSSGYYDAYYQWAMQVRTKLFEEFRAAFREVDLIAGPTTPTPAFKLGQHTSDPLAMYLEDIYTVTANLAGLPGISIPCGFARAGISPPSGGVKEGARGAELPVGLQLLGPQLGDESILQAAMAYQRVTDWHLSEPPLGSGIKHKA